MKPWHSKTYNMHITSINGGVDKLNVLLDIAQAVLPRRKETQFHEHP